MASSDHARGNGKRTKPHRSQGLVVVTGAAGFIGSSLCEALLAEGWRVRGVDAFTANYDPAQKRANLAHLLHRQRFELVEADLTLVEMAALLESADAVAHLAGEPGVSTSWGTEFSRYVERNVLATQRLLDAAASRRLRRFVYASSSSIYGSVNGPVTEDTTPHPASPYGVTKLAAEHLVGVYAAQGLPAVSLRYFSVYGPRQRPDMALHRFIEAGLAGRPITVYGNGNQVRDLTYVADVVAATMAALTAELNPGTVLNVAGGQPVCVAELVTLVRQLLGLDVMAAENEPERPGDVAQTNGSILAAEQQLNWRPRTNLAEGVLKQVEWHISRLRGTTRLATVMSANARRATRRGERLLIYTQDGLGLGHLRRAGSIAAEFLKGHAAGSVLTISDSPLGTLLRDVPHHDYLKLPSIVKAGPGNWHALSLPVEFSDLRQLRARLILQAATTFQPDVVLVDHMPHGAMGELTPTLDALKCRPVRIILGLRDILDAPDVVERRWKTEGAYDALGRYYDQVLVYGSQEIFDLPREYNWPIEFAELVEYCGYVCTPARPDHPRRVRTRNLGAIPDGRLIVAMAGGGADAYELMSALLKSFPEISASQRCALVLVTGPFMPEVERRDLKRRAERLSVRLRASVDEPLSYIAAADLVVAMAGYNTTMEILRLGTPALVVPRRGPSAEQRMRASLFAERGWIAQLDPDELPNGRLADAVLTVLAADPPAHRGPRPDLDGLDRTIEQLEAAVLDARAGITTRRTRAPALPG